MHGVAFFPKKKVTRKKFMRSKAKRVKVKGRKRSKVKVTINVKKKRQVGSCQRQVALFMNKIKKR